MRITNFFRTPVVEPDALPLKVALERKPEEFIHFYQSALVLSLALVLARAPVVAAAFRWWGVDCGRPLALWLIVDAFLAAVHIPLRVGLLASLPWPATSPVPSSLAFRALPVLSSKAALLSKRVATVHFVWNLVGVLWGLEARDEGCPLRVLTRFVVSLTLLRTAVLLGFYYTRVCRPPPVAMIRYSRARADQDLFGETSCAVCLSEFCEHQPLRQFACRHAFCAECADRWLQVSPCLPGLLATDLSGSCVYAAAPGACPTAPRAHPWPCPSHVPTP